MSQGKISPLQSGQPKIAKDENYKKRIFGKKLVDITHFLYIFLTVGPLGRLENSILLSAYLMSSPDEVLITPL